MDVVEGGRKNACGERGRVDVLYVPKCNEP